MIILSEADLGDPALDPLLIINEKRTTNFQECFYFARYCDDSLVLWYGDIEKLNDSHKILNTFDEKLKFTMKIGGNSSCFLDLKISI